MFFDAKEECITLSDGIRANSANLQEARPRMKNTYEISANALQILRRRNRGQKSQRLKIFAASLADIDKVLSPKKKIDPGIALPEQYREFLDVFDPKEAHKLPQHRGTADHSIELIEADKNGKKPEVPWIRYTTSPEKNPWCFGRRCMPTFQRRAGVVCKEARWRPLFLCRLPRPEGYHQKGPLPSSSYTRDPTANL